MLLKSDRIELPERVEPISTRLAVYPGADDKALAYTIATLIAYPKLKSLKRVRGKPVYYALVDNAKTTTLHVHPEPDKPYRAKFRYCTPFKEL